MLCDLSVCGFVGARVPSVKIKLHVEKKESYRPKGGLISINIADRCVMRSLTQVAHYKHPPSTVTNAI